MNATTINATGINAAWETFTRTTNAVLAPARMPEDAERLYALMDATLEEMDARGDSPSSQALLHIVGTLIEEWEAEHEPPIPDTDPREHLREIMQERGISQYQLAKEGVVSQSTLSQILAGKREISRALAKKLSARFNMSPAVFL